MEKITYIGKTNHRNTSQIFGIKPTDRRQHIYIIGKTGTGKSTLLKNLLIQDIQNGHGVGLIDPHGDLAQELLEYIPASRIPRTVYFNPADTEFPIGLNILRKVPAPMRPLVASGVVSAFKNIFRDSWGYRLEYILYNAVAALLDFETGTLLGIFKLLSDEKYRAQVVSQVEDPLIKGFWEKEFAAYDKKFRQEAIAPVQNKVGQFLGTPIIRNIVGQVKSTVDFDFIMNNGYIFIANLSKGQLGEDKANLLGSLLVSQFQLAAMGRATIPEPERRDYFLHVDEFHNFTTTSFDSILAEARKYRLSLSLCHQYIEQLREETRSAVFGNVGTLITFRVGGRDAEHLARELEGVFGVEDLVALDKYHVYLKLLIDGIASRPFSAETLPTPSPAPGLGAKVVRISRERFGKRRSAVEEKINHWLGK